MSKIESSIKNELNNGRKILSVFLTAGFPKIEQFPDLVLNSFEAGADIIEVGVPFSDPIADGSVIQYSSQIAISNGVNLENIFSMIEQVKRNSDKPVILMSYANPIYHYGLKNFFSACRQTKIDGLIVPDIPIEEYDDFFSVNSENTDIILLVSPTTDDDRIIQIGNISRGFVYCVSVKGITGERNSADEESIKFVRRVKSLLPDKNVLVGFGISSPEIAKTFASISDGVIVGSSIIKSLIEEGSQKTIEKIKSLKAAITT